MGAELFDNTGSFVAAFANVQDAINAAGVDFEVKLTAGDVSEQLIIDGKTNLTLTGLGNQANILVPSAQMQAFDDNLTGDTVRAQIMVRNSDNVILQDLFVDGTGIDQGGYRPQDIQASVAFIDASGQFLSSSIIKTHGPTLPNGQLKQTSQGTSLYLSNEDGTDNDVRVFGNIFSAFQDHGIHALNMNVDIDNNHLFGSGNQVEVFQDLIFLAEGTVGSVSNNVLSNFSFDAPGYPIGGDPATGIYLFRAGSVSITGNTIDGDTANLANVGVYNLDSPPAFIQNNDFVNLTIGVEERNVLAPSNYDNVSGLMNTYANMFEGGIWVDSVGATIGAVLRGTADDDYFNDGSGPSSFFGYDGNDTFFGNGGNDKFYGFAGHDFAQLGAGADLAIGHDGNDNFQGREGVDRLYGNSGDDTLHGGGGADTLIGGTGADILLGGDANDRLFGDGEDTFDGGAGTDRLIGHGTTGLTVNLFAINVENALGTESNDDIDGSNLTQRTVIVGKGGGDVLRGGSGNDLLEGRDQNDQLRGNDGDDYLSGGNHNDTLFGLADNDTLLGGNGDDLLMGGDGNDRLFGNAGSDVFDGGLGDDYLYLDADDNLALSTGNIGTDRGYLQGATGMVVDAAAMSLEWVSGTSGDDQISGFGSPVGVELFGNNGNDILNGTHHNDRLLGGNDDDVLSAYFGDDFIHGGAGSDTASFSGNQADYTVVVNNPGVSATITRIANGDVNTLSLVEFAQFDDGTIAI